jgi:hypothetical protein
MLPPCAARIALKEASSHSPPSPSRSDRKTDIPVTKRETWRALGARTRSRLVCPRYSLRISLIRAIASSTARSGLMPSVLPDRVVAPVVQGLSVPAGSGRGIVLDGTQGGQGVERPYVCSRFRKLIAELPEAPPLMTPKRTWGPPSTSNPGRWPSVRESCSKIGTEVHPLARCCSHCSRRFMSGYFASCASVAQSGSAAFWLLSRNSLRSPSRA